MSTSAALIKQMPCGKPSWTFCTVAFHPITGPATKLSVIRKELCFQHDEIGRKKSQGRPGKDRPAGSREVLRSEVQGPRLGGIGGDPSRQDLEPGEIRGLRNCRERHAAGIRIRRPGLDQPD